MQEVPRLTADKVLNFHTRSTLKCDDTGGINLVQLRQTYVLLSGFVRLTVLFNSYVNA